MKYNHAYSISFSLYTSENDPYKVSGAELRKAILERLDNLSDMELQEEAVDCWDTYEIEEE